MSLDVATDGKPDFGALHIPWTFLPDSDPIDFTELVWRAANTIEENPEKWGWQRSQCSVCGERSIRWDQVNGYRCEAHLGPPLIIFIPEDVVVGYIGWLDRSGDYEHAWTLGPDGRWEDPDR